MSDVEIVEDEEDEISDQLSTDYPTQLNSDYPTQIKKIDSELRSVKLQIKMLEGRRRGLERKRNELIEKQQDKETEKLKEENWGRKDFEWSSRLDAARVNVFGLDNYRADQLPVINASMSGHDVLLIMPTGGGKSLTYQLPAVISEGVTLVVSPLISLMEDQLIALQTLGVNAAVLNSSTEKEEKSRILKEMSNSSSNLKLLYVTPEKCSKSKQFMTKLQKLYQMGRLVRIAIDEVHCCSQWGHDFRPDYKFLGAMKGMFPEVPVLGLTATSTANVTKDVKEILRIPKAMVFMAGFNRPNLHYSVRIKPDQASTNYSNLAEIIGVEFKNQSGIIYTTTTKEVETLTDELRKFGLKVGSYHAQMEPEARSKVHRRWLKGEIQTVVATVAFGMGIDKPDVRFVIHNTLSKSMENFYQESGRAGRDGNPAKCILQFRLGDVFKQSTMVFTEQTGLDKLYSMVSYCLNSVSCRRNLIAEHFLESWEPVPCNKMCDICEDNSLTSNEEDITEYARASLRILEEAKKKEVRVTGLKLVEALQGRGANNLKIEGWKGGFSKDKIEMIVAYLLVEGYIKEDFHFTPYSTISYLVVGGQEIRSILVNLPDNDNLHRNLSKRGDEKSGKIKSAKISAIKENKNGGSGNQTKPKKMSSKRGHASDSDEDFEIKQKVLKSSIVISDSE